MKEKELAKSIPEDQRENVLKIVESKRGSRLTGNSTKIQEMKNGQFRVTIPKAQALGYGLKNGSIVDWEITQRGLLLKRGAADGKKQ